MIHMQDLTIIVPTKNESDNMSAFLSSIPEDVALVVVDASDDDTCEKINRLRPHHTVIINEACNISAARQIGANVAQTPWLLFTDADVIFPDGYFDCFNPADDEAVLYGPKRSAHAYVAYYDMIAKGQGLSHLAGIPAATGSNMVVRKDALKAVGGFDVNLPCNEDSELVWRIARAGYKTRFDPHLSVYATDHRRLEGGCASKTLHSLARCFLLYFDLMPARWRYKDWGYWRPQE